MTGAAAVGVNFGLIGGLVAAGVAAVEEGKGRRQLDAAVKQSGFDPGAVFSRQFREEVEAQNLFDTKAATPAARFELEVTSWGFGAAGADRVAGKVMARAKLMDAAGKEVWSRFTAAISATSGTIVEFQADPRLFARSMEDASRLAARKLTGEWE